MSSVLSLYRLQKIDTQIDQSSIRLAEIEKLLSEDASLRQARLEFSEAEDRLTQARHTLSLAEDEVKAQQFKIEENEAALYGGKIRNPKELQDLQNDVASLKRHLTDHENNELEAMLALEQAEEGVKTKQELLKTVQGEYASKQASNLGAKLSIQKDQDRLEAERKAVIAAIPPDDLKLYERLRQQKRGIAVVTVADGSCEACGSTLTPAEWQNARQPNKINFCPTCGRMLYAG